MYCWKNTFVGGNALKYYSSVRLDVRRKESLRDNSGVTVKVKVGLDVGSHRIISTCICLFHSKSRE